MSEDMIRADKWSGPCLRAIQTKIGVCDGGTLVGIDFLAADGNAFGHGHWELDQAELVLEQLGGAVAQVAAKIKGFGATGGFPEGRSHADDEGGLQFGIRQTARGEVEINFGKPIAWVSMPRAQAREMAALLLKAAGKEGAN